VDSARCQLREAAPTIAIASSPTAATGAASAVVGSSHSPSSARTPASSRMGPRFLRRAPPLRKTQAGFAIARSIPSAYPNATPEPALASSAATTERRSATESAPTRRWTPATVAAADTSAQWDPTAWTPASMDSASTPVCRMLESKTAAARTLAAQRTSAPA
jgi:hypothetical protein